MYLITYVIQFVFYTSECYYQLYKVRKKLDKQNVLQNNLISHSKFVSFKRTSYVCI